MTAEFNDLYYWEEINELSSEELKERLKQDAPFMKASLEDDQMLFEIWEAFFQARLKQRIDLFEWLLSLRPEMTRVRRPEPLEYNRKLLKGLTLFQYMLLFKRFKAYYELLEYCFADCDSDGNSSLYYAALADDFELFQRLWSALGADGSSATLPGPQTALTLVKADWLRILRNVTTFPPFIEVLGGLESALQIAIRERSSKLANLFLVAFAKENFEEALKIAMNESIVKFNTLYQILMYSIEARKEVKLPLELILPQLFQLCTNNKQLRRFLLLIATLKKQTPSLTADELVKFTGAPYKLLLAIANYSCVLGFLENLKRNAFAFELGSSKRFGTYLHFLCQGMANYQNLKRCRWCKQFDYGNNAKWYTVLDQKYFPALFELTKAEQWTGLDENGKKPIEYLGVLRWRLDPKIVNEIKRLSSE